MIGTVCSTCPTIRNSAPGEHKLQRTKETGHGHSPVNKCRRLQTFVKEANLPLGGNGVKVLPVPPQQDAKEERNTLHSENSRRSNLKVLQPYQRVDKASGRSYNCKGCPSVIATQQGHIGSQVTLSFDLCTRGLLFLCTYRLIKSALTGAQENRKDLRAHKWVGKEEAEEQEAEASLAPM